MLVGRVLVTLGALEKFGLALIAELLRLILAHSPVLGVLSYVCTDRRRGAPYIRTR